MGILRVHELAKKLSMSNKELIKKLIAKGFLVKTCSSSINEKAARQALGVIDSSKNEMNKTRTILRRRQKNIKENTEDIEDKKDKKNKEDRRIEKKKNTEKKIIPENNFLKIKKMNKNLNTKKIFTGKKLDLDSSNQSKVIGSIKNSISPKNVVRVIDPDAIRSRLASEGKSFGEKRGNKSNLLFNDINENKKRTIKKEQVGKRNYKNNIKGNEVFVNVKNKNNKFSKKKSNKEYLSGYRFKQNISFNANDLRANPNFPKKRKIKNKKINKNFLTKKSKHKKVIEFDNKISVSSLSHKMSVKSEQVVSKLMDMGVLVSVNELLDIDTAILIANEFGYELKNISFQENNVLIKKDNPKNVKKRSPIVVVLGHVDHGKTSILDAIRNTSMIKSEVGGITQRISAYSIFKNNKKITFLDTPGHKFFKSMRERGAILTDIGILVIAADDGIMPQTIEAIDDFKKFKVPIIVAINKIDILNSDTKKITNELSKYGIISEEWGGDTQIHMISAKKKIGINNLLNGINLQADIMNLKADHKKRAEGLILEAKLDKGRGSVITILIKSGILKNSDYIIAGKYNGKIRAIYDFNGNTIKEAGPSDVVDILGISGIPHSGDRFNVVKNGKIAKVVSKNRVLKKREKKMTKNSKVAMENFLKYKKTKKRSKISIIIKTDVYGSIEAISFALHSLMTKEIRIDIIYSGIGMVTENDVNLAITSKSIIIAFNTKSDTKAQILLNKEKINIKFCNIIYNVVEYVKDLVDELILKKKESECIGKAEIREVIHISKTIKIAGSYILKGLMLKGGKVRIIRNSKILIFSKIISLKRFKDDVQEMSFGYECGITFFGFDNFKKGDIVECFK
jgi:translation initiation factor IF-2